MKLPRAVFQWSIVCDVVVIWDKNVDMTFNPSVTNDIENVIEEINSLIEKYTDIKGIGNRKVIYRDSDLMYDEVVVKKNTFSKFKPIQEQSYLKAIEAISK